MQLRRCYRRFSMLKRVHSHIKVRKPAFLDVGLSANQRSKSLTQINCVGGSEGVLQRKEKMDNRIESETSGRHTLAPPPGGTGHVPDRLLVPPSHGEEGDKRARLLKLHHKISNQDYFSVTFDLPDDSEYEILPATKGNTVRDVLQGILERRGLDIHNVSVYVDASSSPLPLNFDTSRLGGTHLFIKVKDTTEGVSGNSTNRPPASRTNSVGSTGSREEKSRKISSQRSSRRSAVMLSTEDLHDMALNSQDGPTKNSKARSALTRRAGIFSNISKTEKERMETLTELLNHYSVNGIPPQSGLLTFDTPNDDLYKLEDHWSDFVENSEALSKRMKNQQDAIWELLHTEVFYIRRLKVITDLFLACLCNLQSEGVLNEIEPERLFSNVVEVYLANHRFWENHLLPMLNTSRVIKQPLQPLLMRQGFLQFDQIFRPYVKYCTDQSKCLQYVKERNKDSELFKAYVAWCETQKDCERLRLTDLLVKPMQRLTKYPLLLKAIKKKTDNEGQSSALLEMNECVENFVCLVDSTLRQQHERERLASILNRIESYDGIESINDELEKMMKEYGYLSLDLTCPMPGCGNDQIRQLLLEGSGLKLRDSSSSKVDVHCFLFTDLFLICKSLGKKGDKVRVIRQPYLVDKLRVQELKDGGGFVVLYLSELQVAVAAFVLYTSEAKIWVDTIRRSQDLYQEAKRTVKDKKGLGFLRASYEEEDNISAARLGSRSPRTSSHSSLIHSHSGSVDTSDPISTASVCGPSTCNKATSFELGDLRNSSVSSEEGPTNERVRANSMETRNGPISVTVTSPRPERRAFFLRGAGSGSSTPNTLSVGPAYHMGDLGELKENEMVHPPPSIQVPLISPLAKNVFPTSRLPVTSPVSPRVASRHWYFGNKPPLLKTKNISGLVTHSAPTSQGPSPVHSFDSDTVVGITSSEKNTPDSEDEDPKKLLIKQVTRTSWRHHTADSVEILKKEREKDQNFHKRLSWNPGQHDSCRSGQLGECPRDKALRNKVVGKCFSSDSMYSSSGVSSTGSTQRSVCSIEYEPSFEGSDVSEDTAVRERDYYDQTVLTDSQRSDDHLQLPTVPLESDIGRKREGGKSAIQIAVNQDSPGGVELHDVKEFLSSTVELHDVKEFIPNNWPGESSNA
ncbi:pleckstrin homology domain-containing family G member 5-like isoform X2 [Tachypleus tridentatus]|uniref:pleckstrin homology domain-containing family G member 5-like isoform X2 n=1 Tax=Tachypleus tridentatus TaxID=6853 RepID=UPI003FD1D22B